MDLQVDATADVKYIPEVKISEDGGAEDAADIIDFEGRDDPADPLNWRRTYKWSMVVLISFLSPVV